MKNLIFINSHPIQYFAPLYKFLNEKGLKTSAWYCSDDSIRGGFDKEFGTNVKWDLPLLAGYDYSFFKNHSPKPSHNNGFFGLVNLGMIRKLFRTPKSVIVVHGWHYFTHLLIILLGKLKGHTICLRYEMPQNQELLKGGWKQNLKRFGMKHFIFPRIDYFLYIGTQNNLLYKAYGLPEKRLLFCPYSVDNNRFKNEFKQLGANKPILKEALGIPIEAKVILYSGKYMNKKRPFDILNAFLSLEKSGYWLVMLGEGELRGEMEAFIRDNALQNVILTGFVNQSEISKYYAVSNVFVMCSSIGETWGLSVNEALNFNIPVVVSDLTGCSIDLVKNGLNGYIFKTGDVNDLTIKVKEVLENEEQFVGASSGIVEKFSYNTIFKNISTIMN